MTSNRIVILARKLDPGGAERQILNLSRGLYNLGEDVHIVVFYRGGLYDNEVISHGIPLHFVGKNSRWDLIGFSLRFVKLIRSLNAGTIYSFMDVPNILSVAFKFLIGSTRIVWGIRSSEIEAFRYGPLQCFISQLEKQLCFLPDKIIANSLSGKNYAIKRGFSFEKIEFIHNGVDTETFKFDYIGRLKIRLQWNVPDDFVLIGVVGRIDLMKDHYNFLRSASLISQRQEKVKFAIIGGGSRESFEKLKNYSVKLGISELIVWSNYRPDIVEVISALDIVVSSSAFGEGFSNAIAEAMSCKRPCVVTDVGDSALIVGALGEVARPRDAQDLADATARMMVRLSSDIQLGEECRSRICSVFSIEKMVLKSREALRGG